MINLIYLEWMKAHGGVVARSGVSFLNWHTEKTGLVTEKYWILALVWWSTALFENFPPHCGTSSMGCPSSGSLFPHAWGGTLWCLPPMGIKHLFFFSSLMPVEMIDHVGFMAKWILLTGSGQSLLTLLWKSNQTRSLSEETAPVWKSISLELMTHGQHFDG